MKNNYININFLLIFFISFLFFVGKWFLSFYFFPNEEPLNRIIFDSHEDSSMYFHYVKSLTDFEFNQNFSLSENANGYLVSPIGSIIFHSIGLKFFGIYSFIILEFVSVYIFLTIFFLILKEFKVSDLTALAFASCFFILPIMIDKINFINIEELNNFSNNFYNLRFPRPLVASLYFYSFIYLLIIANNDNLFKREYLIYLAIITSLSFSSFFFIFVNQIISLLIIFTFKYKSKIFSKLFNNFQSLIIFLTLFFIISSPYLALLSNANQDYLERLGVISINLEDKIYLIHYYFEKLLRLKVLGLYVFIITIYFLNKKFFNENQKIINIFLVIFISSIISPLLFILITNKISFLYHFNNIILISAALLILFILISILLGFSRKYKFEKLSLIGPILIILICLTTKNYNFFNTDKIKKNIGRSEMDSITKLIKNNSSLDVSKTTILTFDHNFMIWAIMNNSKSLKIVDGTFSIKSHDLIEMDLIETFKFLNLKKEDFENFILNKKRGYRYINDEMRMLFWQKYQANSLYTFKNSQNFEAETLKFINNSSPFYAHQFAIPTSELKRLVSKFKNVSINKNYKPDIIIINLSKKFLKKTSLNKDNYCKVFDGTIYKMYLENKYCK